MAEAAWTTEPKILSGSLQGKFAHLWISGRCTGVKHRFESLWALDGIQAK